MDKSVGRLFYWASYADKYGGCVQVRERCGNVEAKKKLFLILNVFIHIFVFLSNFIMFAKNTFIKRKNVKSSQFLL